MKRYRVLYIALYKCNKLLLLLLLLVCGFLNVPQSCICKQGFVRRDLRLSSLSEKTRKSNHLQLPLQRQHFLINYLKTLSVDPAGDELTTSRVTCAARCSTTEPPVRGDYCKVFSLFTQSLLKRKRAFQFTLQNA